jgi:hypothetical protein
MTSQRQMKLGAFMRPTTIHTGAWRYPGAFPDANFNLAHLMRFAISLSFSYTIAGGGSFRRRRAPRIAT